MGEVFQALANLNTTLKLGLTGDQLLRAEGSFKNELARRANFPKEAIGTGTQLAEQWEIMTYLKPRATPLSMTRLQELAKQSVAGTTTSTIGGTTLTKTLRSSAAKTPGAKKTARKSTGRGKQK